MVTTQPLNMEFLPQIAQIYADLKPPKVVYWRKLIKKDFILICDVCVICGKYLFMNSLNRLSSYLYCKSLCLMEKFPFHLQVQRIISFLSLSLMIYSPANIHNMSIRWFLTCHFLSVILCCILWRFHSFSEWISKYQYQLKSNCLSLLLLLFLYNSFTSNSGSSIWLYFFTKL